jgi:hypothetical protein
MKKTPTKTKKVAPKGKEVKKVGHVWGHWVQEARRTETLICECGNKYIKTRKHQTVCLWCLKEEGVAIGR